MLKARTRNCCGAVQNQLETDSVIGLRACQDFFSQTHMCSMSFGNGWYLHFCCILCSQMRWICHLQPVSAICHHLFKDLGLVLDLLEEHIEPLIVQYVVVNARWKNLLGHDVSLVDEE